jgi:hypothetical protein
MRDKYDFEPSGPTDWIATSVAATMVAGFRSANRGLIRRMLGAHMLGQIPEAAMTHWAFLRFAPTTNCRQPSVKRHSADDKPVFVYGMTRRSDTCASRNMAAKRYLQEAACGTIRLRRAGIAGQGLTVYPVYPVYAFLKTFQDPEVVPNGNFCDQPYTPYTLYTPSPALCYIHPPPPLCPPLWSVLPDIRSFSKTPDRRTVGS